MIPIPEENREEQMVIMATRDGLIKKTALSEFRSLRKAGLIAITLRDEDSLIGVALTDGKQNVLLATRKGKAICFNEERVRMTGRGAMGVRSIRLDEGDEVVSMCLVEEDSQLLSITTNGYGKRTPFDEYRETGRGGKGVTAMRLTEKTGDLVKMLAVKKDEDVLIITDGGTIIRTAVIDIRQTARATQGVCLMRVGEATIVDVARAEQEEEEHLVDGEALDTQGQAPQEDLSESAAEPGNEQNDI